jgi:hypothetical protein
MDAFGVVVFHPSRKNKNAARVGQPTTAVNPPPLYCTRLTVARGRSNQGFFWEVLAGDFARGTDREKDAGKDREDARLLEGLGLAGGPDGVAGLAGGG